MPSPELKRCPFCGGAAAVTTGTDRLGYWWAKAYCRFCRAGIKDSYNPKRDWVGIEEGAREVAAAWNRRAETEGKETKWAST